jgi:hypothetical protein
LKESTPAWSIVQALCSLQVIDNDTRTIAVERDRLRTRLTQLTELISRGKDDLSNRRRKIEDAESWFQDQLQSVEIEKEKIAKLKGKLGSVTKSKEYMAIQRELETLRQIVNEKQEELDKFTEALGSHKSAVEEEESKLTSLENEANEEEEATQGRIKKFDKKINASVKKRAQWTDHIPPDVLRRYERVKSRREGVAIVRAQSGRCSGCHMNIPPQLFNVLLRRDSIEICPSCNRYVYVALEESAE